MSDFVLRLVSESCPQNHDVPNTYVSRVEALDPTESEETITVSEFRIGSRN